MEKLWIFEELSNTSCFHAEQIEKLILKLTGTLNCEYSDMDHHEVRKNLSKEEYFPDATAEFFKD